MQSMKSRRSLTLNVIERDVYCMDHVGVEWDCSANAGCTIVGTCPTCRVYEVYSARVLLPSLSGDKAEQLLV